MRVFALMLLLVSGVSLAAERSYAVLSLVGDKLLVAHFQPTTGTRLDSNVRRFVGIPDGSLDRAAVEAVEKAIRKQDGKAEVTLLLARDEALYAAQDPSLEEGAGGDHVMPALAPVLRGVKATHLVLVTKYRGPASFRLADGRVGSGSIEGLGFYIDDHLRVQRRDTGAFAPGFLAPFALVRYSLIDLSTQRTLKEEVVKVSRVTASASALTAWSTMTAESKADALRLMLGRAAELGVPKVLSP